MAAAYAHRNALSDFLIRTEPTDRFVVEYYKAAYHAQNLGAVYSGFNDFGFIPNQSAIYLLRRDGITLSLDITLPYRITHWMKRRINNFIEKSKQ